MTQYPNWFRAYADVFFTYHLLEFKGRSGLRFLQIGVFTGDATLWLFKNVLTGHYPTLVDVDTWEGSDEPEHEPFDWADVERVYDERTADLVDSGRLLKFKRTSRAFFRAATEQNPDSSKQFDFIYVDGAHTAVGVLSDAVHAYPLLKVGGLIAFDDYLWKSGEGRLHDPAPAIDAVADLYGDRLQRLLNPPGQPDLQVWFRRVA